MGLVCLVLSEGPGMLNGGRWMRAFRPSYFTPTDVLDEVTEQAKEVNVLRYAARAQAGLPLFESLSEARQLRAGPIRPLGATGS